MSAAKKNKLRVGDRRRLRGLAAKMFKDVKLRLKEQTAKDKFISLFMADYKREIEPHLESMSKVADMGKRGFIQIPSITYIMDKEKEHTLPNGTVVKRTGVATQKHYGELQYRSGKYDYNSGTLYETDARTHADRVDINFETYRTSVDLPEKIYLPDETLSLIRDQASESADYKIGYSLRRGYDEDRHYSKYGFCVSPDTVKAHHNFILANVERVQAEYELINAINSIIASSEYFEELALLWPEAELVRDELYPPSSKIAASNSLIVINDDLREKLCKNLKSRGVSGSLVCDIASPKHGHAKPKSQILSAA